jgi:hypothetical protein
VRTLPSAQRYPVRGGSRPQTEIWERETYRCDHPVAEDPSVTDELLAVGRPLDGLLALVGVSAVDRLVNLLKFDAVEDKLLGLALAGDVQLAVVDAQAALKARLGCRRRFLFGRGHRRRPRTLARPPSTTGARDNQCGLGSRRFVCSSRLWCLLLGWRRCRRDPLACLFCSLGPLLPTDTEQELASLLDGRPAVSVAHLDNNDRLDARIPEFLELAPPVLRPRECRQGESEDADRLLGPESGRASRSLVFVQRAEVECRPPSERAGRIHFEKLTREVADERRGLNEDKRVALFPRRR